MNSWKTGCWKVGPSRHVHHHPDTAIFGLQFSGQLVALITSFTLSPPKSPNGKGAMGFWHQNTMDSWSSGHFFLDVAVWGDFFQRQYMLQHRGHPRPQTGGARESRSILKNLSLIISLLSTAIQWLPSQVEWNPKSFPWLRKPVGSGPCLPSRFLLHSSPYHFLLFSHTGLLSAPLSHRWIFALALHPAWNSFSLIVVASVSPDFSLNVTSSEPLPEHPTWGSYLVTISHITRFKVSAWHFSLWYFLVF